MLLKASLLGALALLTGCSAVAHKAPGRIDLERRPGPRTRVKYGIETVTEKDVSFTASFKDID